FLDHAEWSQLLRTYVDERGLVDYASWKTSRDGRDALAAYLARLAGAPEPPAGGDDRSASLINAYNALTVAWILDHYPTASIRALPDSFTAARHTLGGRPVSLDQIEHEALRPQVGYRVHAALVCAARSCPPLAREAFTAPALDRQLDAAMERWLARDDLNRFDAAGSRARVSSIFRWFAPDFEKAGGVARVIERHGPPPARALAKRPELVIDYLDYDWTLNDQRPAASYGRLRLLWDRLRSLV
ncbi:MAG TPA: DUF547 domain-containing protein, partial [Vicinamibacteria bacterium]|nr:DUF547 domain-containing protein [Vicinamibacteria bacterium]